MYYDDAMRHQIAALPTSIILGAFFCSLFVFSFAHADMPALCPHVWEVNLKLGSTGADVRALQQFLNASADTILASSGTGSAGNETTTFGPATKKAVIAFQNKYAADILTPNGLTAGTGMVGTATRAKLNALCPQAAQSEAPAAANSSQVASSAGAATLSGDTLAVTDPGQPASSLVPSNAAGLFLSFTLAAGDKDITVNTITVERDGPGTDGSFDSLGLYGEDGLQIGNIVSLNSSHQATFRQPFIVPAHSSQKLDVYVNTADLTNFDGQAPYVKLIGITASSPVSGTIPLAGNPQTMNSSLVVGSGLLTLSSYDPNTDSIHYINDRGVRFSGIRITADSTEDLTLWNIIWNQTGTAGPGDLANVATVVDGTSTATKVRGNDYISIFDPAIIIQKGHSVDVYIQGDLTTTGSNRTVKFDIHDNSDDISLSGNTYGFAVGAYPNGNTATDGHSVFLTDTGDTSGNSLTPFFSGSVVTINPGSLISVGR
jgi:hypothetical protein